MDDKDVDPKQPGTKTVWGIRYATRYRIHSASYSAPDLEWLELRDYRTERREQAQKMAAFLLEESSYIAVEIVEYVITETPGWHGSVMEFQKHKY